MNKRKLTDKGKLHKVSVVLHSSKNTVSFRSLVLVVLFAIGSNISLFPHSATAATAKLTIGAYNILGANHGGGSSGVGTNAKIIASTMAYDVVGISEYREYAADSAEKDNGPLITKLNSDYGGTWQASKAVKDSTVDQTRFIWNTSTVTLVQDSYYESDNVYDSISGTFGDNDKNCFSANGSSGNCPHGGSRFVHIATFTLNATGEEFVVVNVHFAQDHDEATVAIRDKQMKNIIQLLQGVSKPAFIVGDTNAHPQDEAFDGVNEYGIYEAAKNAGYATAYTTATTRVNEKYATAANRDTLKFSNKSVHVIDQIFYKNVAAPSYYETYGCSSVSACGSDHRPVRAIFDSLSGSVTGSTSCTEDGMWQQLADWEFPLVDPSCSPCTENSSLSGTMSGETNLEKIATYLASKGLNAIAIAGIFGNWRIESTSSLTPFVQQFSSNWPSGGYGLAQWSGSRRTYSDGTGVVDVLRKDARTKEYFSEYYADKYAGRTPDSGIPEGVPEEVNDAWLQVELDFMLEEFTQSQYIVKYGHYSMLKEAVPYVNKNDDIKTALNSAKSAGDAAIIFSLVFEKQNALGTAVTERAPQAEKDFAQVTELVGSGTADTSSATNCSDSSATITGLPEGGVKDTAEGRKQAWQIAQMFIDDINKRYPDLNAPHVNVDAGYDDTSVDTPGTRIKDSYDYPCWGGASRCGQCYALTAWFVDKFTTVTMGTTTGGADGVVKYMAKDGVSTGSVAKVYSVFSYGAAEGGSGMHTGVVVGIDGDYAITIENNWAPGGRLVIRKHNKNGATFRDSGSGRTSFAYVAEKFRLTPKEYE